MKKLFTILVSLLVTASVYSQTYKVNTEYAELGGYVIKTDGKHGVVVAMDRNQGFASNYGEVEKVLSDNSNYNSDAAKFNDWRVPYSDELKIIYDRRRSIRGLYNSLYWSGTGCGFQQAYIWAFSKGKPYCMLLEEIVPPGERGPSVRAVRDF